jgi:hypothetical protein
MMFHQFAVGRQLLRFKTGCKERALNDFSAAVSHS